jgi:Na+/H+ antiporter NhaA
MDEVELDDVHEHTPRGGIDRPGDRRAGSPYDARALSDQPREIRAAGSPLQGRTAWARNKAAPVREFLRAEAGSSIVLLVATIAALVWANVATSSYVSFWTTDLSISVGSHALDTDLRHWVNEGLMAFFFFVVGLEARREFDMGELRERRRITLPVLAGLGGMTVPILIYLAFNLGGAGSHGWGAAMSTDTAFALGMLALVGPRCPDRLRVFMLTVVVVDDVVALVVIAVAYTDHVAIRPLAVAIACFALALTVRTIGISQGLIYLAIGAVGWVALFESGVQPEIIGLALGLVTGAYAATRVDLERATQLVRSFREQPTPELAREARLGVASAISPNERAQALLHPWTSYAVVPIFALANAGVVINEHVLRRATSSPITVGIVLAYVIGKPVGIVCTSWLAVRASGGELRPPVGWAALRAGAALAGIGFTVALLISSLAFSGEKLAEAKIGVLVAAVGASVVGWALFRVLALISPEARARSLAQTADIIVDLAVAVDPDIDHIRGRDDAPVTIVEYADFECPYCGQAEPALRDLLAEFGDDLRYVFRHLPLLDVHPRAQIAAEAAEGAGEQGKFWEMHDELFAHQNALRPPDLVAYANALGLDGPRIEREVRHHEYSARIARDVESADLSGVTGTPTFFINGHRHQGAYDLASLATAVRAARQRAILVQS